VVFGAAAVLLDSGLLQQLKRWLNRRKHISDRAANLSAAQAAAAYSLDADNNNIQRQKDEPAEGTGVMCNSRSQQAMVSIVSLHALVAGLPKHELLQAECSCYSCCLL
jgi:hypothetical protein